MKEVPAPYAAPPVPEDNGSTAVRTESTDWAADGPPPESAADAARLRVWEHLAELAERLDPDSFALFLKVVSGLNSAFSQRNQRVEVRLTPQELQLYTPLLERELTALLEKASTPSNRIIADIVPTGRDDDAAAGAGRAEG